MLHSGNKGPGLFIAQTVQRRTRNENDLSQVRLVTMTMTEYFECKWKVKLLLLR